MNIELVNKKKLHAEDYGSVLLVISFLLFALVFRLEALIAIAVYPFVTLAFFGFLKIFKGFNKKFNNDNINVNKVLLGTIYIIISVLWLYYLLIQTNFTIRIIIYLIAFPLLNTGFVGFIKGLIINIYSIKQRIITIIVSIITMIICFISMFYTSNDYLLIIVVLSLLLVLNIFSRAALYLSEYGLSVLHIKNFVLFFYIISDYLLYVGRDGTVLLAKIG
ncbi:MAG: hypothetical protein JSV23_10230 [Promethearchaeota archaeon]|nr:MAG: hypothetical protein JSV23_10230 [Candidatus Lokiarchaeota archaeon]